MNDSRVIRSWLDPRRSARFRELGLWGDQTVAELFDSQVRCYPDKLAVADQQVRWTYRDLQDKSLRLARLLLDFGVRPGEPVVAQLPSCALVPLLHLAANRIGALLVPMATGWRRVEVSALTGPVAARLLVSVPHDEDFDLRGLHRDIVDDLPELATVAYFRDDQDSLEQRLEATDPLDSRWAADLRSGPDVPAHVLVSSGSTGVPKASVYSDNNLLTMLLHHTVSSLQLVADDVAAGIAPASLGSTGYLFPVLTPLLIGASSVMLEEWSPAASLALMSAERATYATAIPTQMVMMLDLDVEGHDLSTLTRFNNAGAPLPLRVAEQVEHRMSCRVQTIYGATDGGVPVMTSITDAEHPRRTSVGRLLPGEEIELRDPFGAVVTDPEPGEVCWRGANKSFGYLNQPDYDEAAFDEAGWFRSGDLGAFDAEGYLRIVGRAKDMILRGGTNIFPFEVEELLGAHPSVASVAVVGVPDERLGERACAVVVPRQQAPTLADLTSYLTESGLARFKHPEHMVIIAEMPTNQGGKLDRPQIRKLAAEQLAGRGTADE